jgi:hypothetical protein
LTGRGGVSVAAFLPAILLAVAAAASPRARPVEYLHVLANEGGASGGHVAIRFGDDVFDFRDEDGLARIRRSEWDAFQYRYRTLENRPIEVSRLALDAPTAGLLRRALLHRELVQDRVSTLAGEARADVRLLAALARPRDGADRPTWPLDGVGFFVARSPAPAPAALVDLRARVAAAHGAGFLALRRATLVEALARLRPEPRGPVPLDGVLPTAPPSFSRRFTELATALLAVDVLEHPRPVRETALSDGGASGAGFDDAARARLRAASAALEARLVQLVASRRPDWGAPLLIGIARLETLDASLAADRPILLDAFGPSAERLPVTRRRRAWLPDAVAEADADWRRAWDDFLASEGWDELAWNGLEEAGSRRAELRSALAGAASMRVEPGRLVPAGRAGVALASLPVSEALRGRARAALPAARAAADRWRHVLLERWGYDLIRRNCASELLRSVEGAGADADPVAEDPAEARARAVRRLGGWIDPSAWAHFVPFVSSRAVRRHWRIDGAWRLPSYRELRVAEMEAREDPLRVALRESNVLTAEAHAGSDRESCFLFFTDTNLLLRPLLGVANLAAGLACSGAGVLALPLDHGRTLRAGLWGAFWSVPELFGVDIRKGANEYVPPEERPSADAPVTGEGFKPPARPADS